MLTHVLNKTYPSLRYLALTFLIVASITPIFLFSPSVFAEKPVSKIYTIPLSVQAEICRGLLLAKDSKQGCKANDQLHLIRSYPLAKNKILLFFFLKNSQERYHRGLTLPVVVDSAGKSAKWVIGSSFLGEPWQLMRDGEQDKSGVWMHAQYNDSGKKPLLLYSRDGLNWLEINLPEGNKKNYQQEGIGKFCFRGNDLHLTLQSIGSGTSPVLTTWKANRTQLLSTTSAVSTSDKQWEKVASAVGSTACVANQVKQSHWSVQEGESLSLLLNDSKNLTIKVPKVIVMEKPIKSVSGEPAVAKTPPVMPTGKTGKGFAIQVGAFKDFSYVNGVITEMQQGGFKTFTKELSIKGAKIKKIYVGPYASRDVATKKMAELRGKFHDDKGIQFSFIVPMN